uniref:Uncharacterized protein n=1 Tax=Oryza punctata TaxID=4537 RepID=A0A0E0JQK0_ORYPU
MDLWTRLSFVSWEKIGRWYPLTADRKKVYKLGRVWVVLRCSWQGKGTNPPRPIEANHMDEAVASLSKAVKSFMATSRRETIEAKHMDEAVASLRKLSRASWLPPGVK